jgi:hydroxymethylpyrimidine/phosphomethylpyrimidine kinase
LQLNTTHRTIQEIAYSCGFSSQAHFTKFFQKMKGMSPTTFRKLKR